MIQIRRITTTIKGKKTSVDPANSEPVDAKAEAERLRLEADYRRTHPPDVERIGGCCDRADQS